MADKNRKPLSSKELLQRIGLGDEPAPNLLLDDEDPDSPMNDLGVALQERLARLLTRHAFKPGDLVMWKPGMRNHRWPRHGEPAVVVEVLTSPILDGEQEAGSTYFREPLDVLLGTVCNEGPLRGELLIWHFDSRRFQLWTSGEGSR